MLGTLYSLASQGGEALTKLSPKRRSDKPTSHIGVSTPTTSRVFHLFPRRIQL